MEDLQRITVICGPTASGKTSLGVQLAIKFDGEVISADSRQVYVGMDIGTSKPTKEERAGIAHHMIDLVFPDEEFNAYMFKEMARRKIGEITSRGKRAIIVGGTGLYIKALVSGLVRGIAPFKEIRKVLKDDLAVRGQAVLYERLKKVDPSSADRIASKDSQRIIRALEVYLATGRPLSSLQESHGFREQPYNVHWIGVRPPRKLLYERIDRRVDEMFKRGFVNEVSGLREKGFIESLPSMKSLGYSELMDYLAGRCKLEEARENIKKNTRRFAKRQMTWFRSMKGIEWYEPEEIEKIFESEIRFYDHPAP